MSLRNLNGAQQWVSENMGIRYESMDPTVRSEMLKELSHYIQIDLLYISPRLNAKGVQMWPQILNDAFESYDDDWITATLHSNALLHSTESRNVGGRITVVKVPHNAAEMLAEGEFNRFYIRGLCACIIAEGNDAVEVVRGKRVSKPRPESQALIGKHLPASNLLANLRNSIGVESVLGIPPGPNSGITIRRIP